MKSQVAKRININLTKEEIENLKSIKEYFGQQGMNTSDCIRLAINSVGQKIKSGNFLENGKIVY
jgi:sulfur relay (sulfurtransferase) DsrC/TusE family protein